MSEPYFQEQSWPPFIYQGVTYSFTHLDEYQVEVTDSAGVVRRIAVTFSDHCFTRNVDAVGDDPALLYPASTCNPGYFCVDRYQHSLGLRGHVAQAIDRRVWNVREGNFAIVPVVNHQGDNMLYGIVFSLDRVTGLPVALHMRVRTAFPCDEAAIATFGEIRFAHLVTLRMQGKSPKLILDRHRKRPRLF
jgi:hypothetical protein